MSNLDKYLAVRDLVNSTEKRALVYGASFSEFVILRAIEAEGTNGIRRVDLAERVSLSVSGITRALAPLEKLGYIEHQEEELDARVRKVSLTKSGYSLFKDIEKDVARLMEIIDSDLQNLSRTLKN
ncbi:MAG: MarR family winged helix-turn-helix transcriptional regulator [Micrococcales bacterium]